MFSIAWQVESLDFSLIGDLHYRQIFNRHGHIYDNRGQLRVGQFTRKRLTIVLIDSPA